MKKFFSIALAIYFLATSVGFGVNTHFCQGKAIKTQVQLFEHELNCGMKMQETVCEGTTATIKKKACCENHFDTYQVEDDFQSADIQLDLHAAFVTAFVYSFLLPEGSVVEKTNFLAYSPPLSQQDYTILYQAFLI